MPPTIAMNINTDPSAFAVGDSGRPLGDATATALGRAYREIGGDPAEANDPSTLALKYFREGVNQMAQAGGEDLNALHGENSETGYVIRYQAMSFGATIRAMQGKVDGGSPLTERQFRNLLDMVSSFKDNVTRSKKIAQTTYRPSEVGKIWKGWQHRLEQIASLPDRPESTHSDSSFGSDRSSSGAETYTQATAAVGPQKEEKPEAGKRPRRAYESVRTRRAKQVPQEKLLAEAKDYDPVHLDPGGKVPGPYAKAEVSGKVPGKSPAAGAPIYEDVNAPRRSTTGALGYEKAVHTNSPPRRARSYVEMAQGDAPRRGEQGYEKMALKPAEEQDYEKMERAAPQRGEQDYEKMAPGVAPQRGEQDYEKMAPGVAPQRGEQPDENMTLKPQGKDQPRKNVGPGPGKEAFGEYANPIYESSARGRITSAPASTSAPAIIGPREYANPGYLPSAGKVGSAPPVLGRGRAARRVVSQPPVMLRRIPEREEAAEESGKKKKGFMPKIFKKKAAAAAMPKKIVAPIEVRMAQEAAAVAKRRRNRGPDKDPR